MFILFSLLILIWYLKLTLVKANDVNDHQGKTKDVASVCNYLLDKHGADTASIDSLFWRDKDAPGKYWVDQMLNGWSNRISNGVIR